MNFVARRCLDECSATKVSISGPLQPSPVSLIFGDFFSANATTIDTAIIIDMDMLCLWGYIELKVINYVSLALSCEGAFCSES